MCTSCKSVPFVHACSELCVYEGVSVCLLSWVLFLLFVAYHDVTAACMPVWVHHTNTMNVDIVQSLISKRIFFFAVVSLVPWKTERWGNFHDCRFGSTSRWRVATSNSLLVTDWFWPFMNPIHHCPKQKPAWTLNILWGSMKKLCWYWLRGVWKRDLGNWVARGIGVESCCNFSYKYCFCIECLSFC